MRSGVQEDVRVRQLKGGGGDISRGDGRSGRVVMVEMVVMVVRL